MTSSIHQKPLSYALVAIALLIIHEQFASVVFLNNVFSYSLFIHYLFDIIFFVITVFTLSKFRLVKVQDYCWFLVINIALVFLYIGLRMVDRVTIRVIMGNEAFFKINEEITFYSYIRGTHILAFALAVDFFRRGKRGEFEAQTALAKQTDLEFALHFTQVSPHFLNNALLFINDLVEPVLPNASIAIKELKSIYRYSSMDMSVIGDVTLGEELNQIKSYLDFQDQLYHYELQVLYEKHISDSEATYKLPPMLLLNFIENAFKHGQFRNPEHPMLFKVFMVDGELHFFTRNLLRQGRSRSGGGLGMKLILAKLEHQFSGRYCLHYGVSGKYYEVELVLRYGTGKV